MKPVKKATVLILALSLLLSSMVLFKGSEAVENEKGPTRDMNEDFIIEVGSEIEITESKKFNKSFFYPVQKGSFVESADMSISVAPLTQDGTDYPEDIAINFANNREYEFNNEELVFQGSWGRNYQTTDGARFKAVTTSAGSTKLRFALPENCTVTSATMDINGSQRGEQFNVTNTTLVTSGSQFGDVLRMMGDTNGDGIDEVLISAPGSNQGAGRVYHFDYPLPQSPLEPTIFASTTQANANFGTSISGPFPYPDNSRTAVAIGAPVDGFSTSGSVRTYTYSPTSVQINHDVLIYGNSSGERFGTSVETCDIDLDGDVELFVGAPDSQGGLGVIYMFNISSTGYELVTVLNGTTGEFHFGRDITVGDMNGDGSPDLIVASDEKVRVFNSDSLWDLEADVEIDPDSDSGNSGFSTIAYLGDTGTGMGSLGVGVPTGTAGSILLYDGGGGFDDQMDLNLVPGKRIEGFGTSFSAGDMDNDGVNEIIVGAPGTSSTKGTVVVMKRTGPTIFKELETQGLEGDMFGFSVCLADLRGDGFVDPIVSAPQHIQTSSTGSGIAYLFEYYDLTTLPSNSPLLKIGSDTIWTYGEDHLSGTTTTGDFSSSVDSYVKGKLTPDYNTDHEGFVFVDITFDSLTTLSTEGSNLFNLTAFDIRYEEKVVFEDMEDNINSFMNSYTDSLFVKDGQKFVPVPLSISADTPGRFIVRSFDIEIDEIPFVQSDPGEIHIPEDTRDDMLFDLYDIFEDNVTDDHYLNISVSAILPNVNVYVTDHRYLGADLIDVKDDLGRNWSGIVDLTFTVKDLRNGTFEYRGIDLVVDEVNDAPGLKTMPSEFVFQDALFVFSPQMTDDEGDDINITIDRDTSPANMSVDYETGTVSWRPNKWEVGPTNYTIVLSDGNDSRSYNFTLEVRNEQDEPVFLSPPPDPETKVLVGTKFTYNFSAIDPDPGDRITYIIVFPIQGAGIDVQTGMFSWTPPQHFPEGVDFVVRATDLDGLTADLEFHLNTTFTDTAPELLTQPITSLFDTEDWTFHFDIVDAEEHRLEITLVEGPEGLDYDEVSQNITWKPGVDQIGDFNLSMRVTSTVFVLYFNYTLSVRRAQRTWDLEIEGIEEGETFKGDVQIGGRLVLEPSTVTRVEIRLDDGDWMEGTYTGDRWSYTLKTDDFDDGEYTLEVRAFDGAEYSNAESINIKIKNEEVKTSPLIYVLIIIAILAIIGLVVGVFFVIKKVQEKKEAEEQEKQRKEAIEASKRSMDDFIKTTGSDLDQNVDYSNMELDDGAQDGEEMEKIDQIFQPLNIPHQEIPEEDYEIPVDPLQKTEVEEGPALESSLPMGDDQNMMDEGLPPTPPKVDLPSDD